jgi:release factor glutamine methyltransferase
VGTVSWRELLAETRGRLGARGAHGGHGSSGNEAQWIVEEASGMSGPELVFGLDEPATERGVARLDGMVARRLAGEPLQYVLGRWGFRSLDLLVDRRVLIPRPETEQLVDLALRELDRLRPGIEGPPCVVDLGSGSGAIGLSVAAERPGTDVWCVDASPDAVAVTRANLAGLGMAGARVRVAEGSWWSALPDELAGRVHLVISNPPYVAVDDPLPAEVADWEPVAALVPGPTGLEAVNEILAGAFSWLAPDGVLLLEIGETQGSAVLRAAVEAGFTDVATHLDLTGRERFVIARSGAPAST